MECAIATLQAFIACFSWSGLFIDTGVEISDQRSTRYISDRYFEDGVYTRFEEWEYSYNRNPFGRFGIGYEVNIGAMTWSIEAKHTSSLDTTKDRGLNAITINARWYPFRN